MSVSLYGSGQTVIQVVQSTITAKVTTSSSSFVNTGLSVSITPQSTTSKFLIMVAGYAGNGTNGLDRVYFLINGMTSASTGDAGSGGVQCTSIVCPRSADAGWAESAIDIKIWDTPNTTSTRTYSLQWRSNGGYTGALGSSVNNDGNVGNTPTTMTVMEISGS
jgi:hypothetical protein